MGKGSGGGTRGGRGQKRRVVLAVPLFPPFPHILHGSERTGRNELGATNRGVLHVAFVCLICGTSLPTNERVVRHVRALCSDYCGGAGGHQMETACLGIVLCNNHVRLS